MSNDTIFYHNHRWYLIWTKEKGTNYRPLWDFEATHKIKYYWKNDIYIPKSNFLYTVT